MPWMWPWTTSLYQGVLCTTTISLYICSMKMFRPYISWIFLDHKIIFAILSFDQVAPVINFCLWFWTLEKWHSCWFCFFINKVVTSARKTKGCTLVCWLYIFFTIKSNTATQALFPKARWITWFFLKDYYQHLHQFFKKQFYACINNKWSL